jgi:hypothetical protein
VSVWQKHYAKNIKRVPLENELLAQLQRICDRRGMTLISAASRLVKWVAKQDEVIQHDILHPTTKVSSEGTNVELLEYLATRH